MGAMKRFVKCFFRFVDANLYQHDWNGREKDVIAPVDS